MEMILTGIENKNEYYTNHYFTSIFQDNAEDTIKKWKKKEKEEENTFYTGSMELSKEDLVSTASESDTDSSDELDEYDEDLKNSHSTFKIVFISFILLLLLAVLGYFVLKQMCIL